MKVISLIFALLASWQVASCELNSSHSYYSLSGPVTMLLEEMKLLESKALKAISVFHPVAFYKGEKLGGGIFLSSKVFAQNEAIVFYDESQELQRSLSKMSKLTLYNIATRGLDVFQATEESLKVLKPYLQDCEKEIERLQEKIQQIKIRVNKKDNEIMPVLFFMQEISASLKYPDMLIVQDGFVSTLLRAQRIKTYDSKLSYVAWSSKKINSDYKLYKRIGLNESSSDELKVSRYNDLNYNLYFRGVFTPGIRQLIFLDEFLKMKEKGQIAPY